MMAESRNSTATRGSCATFVLGAGILMLGILAGQGAAKADPGDDAAELGRKLSDPTSNVWALFTEFDLTFSDGDLNQGDDRVGGNLIFQPILPFPLYGEGEDQWKLILRPTVPFTFSTAIPRSNNEFFNVAGLADTTLPMLVSPPPPAKGLIFGVGPTWFVPTATRDELGLDQFGLGPAGVLGYKNKQYTVGVFPQYYYKIGTVGNQTGSNSGRRALNRMSLLYFAFLNLPNAWQVGFNPVITYDRRQERENRWNVPVGLLVTKTTKAPLTGTFTKFQFGMEYSVKHQDDFGKRFLIKLNVIPVIPGLVERPIFGGG
jgi:hypothetical protein